MSARTIPAREELVHVEVDGVTLEGNLVVPPKAAAIVLFAHGSGSSRHSPRNGYVAEVLREGGMATLLFDLLTCAEEKIDARTARLRFDMELLANRLGGAAGWIAERPGTADLRIGYFGASTGAGAALIAAARRPAAIGAVVSRGGRPDLAGAASLVRVKSPTLLIVGGNDPEVLRLNERALARLGCEKRLEVVPGATHLFEEPGTLEHAARLARDWFVRHLSRRRS